jgi:hypothetical protein
MKLSDVQIGVEYLVVSPWVYANKDTRNPDKVGSDKLTKVTLTNLTRYAASTWYTVDTAFEFELAQEGSRTFGFLVEEAVTGKRFVVSPRNIVGEASGIESRWAAEKIEKEAAAAERIALQEQQKRRVDSIKAAAQKDVDSIIQLLKVERIAKAEQINYHNSYYADRSEHIPEASLPISVLVVLVEKYLSLKDQLED